jgi:parallel beta-helix repeat protein
MPRALCLVGLAAVGIVYLRGRETKGPSAPADENEQAQRELEERIKQGDAVHKRAQALTEIRETLKTTPDEGIRRLQELIKQSPASSEACEARLILAEALAARKDTQGALGHLEAVVADPNAGLRASRARIERAKLLAATDPAAARRDLQAVLRDVPHPAIQPAARVELGLLEIREGQFAQAIAALAPVLERKYRERPEAQNVLRKAVVGELGRLAKAGEPKALMAWSEEVMKRFPDLAALATDIRYYQAVALRQVGRFTDARNLFERLRRQPDLLPPDANCDAELARLTEEERAAGVVRSRDAFLQAKREGKETRADFEGALAADTTWAKDNSPLVLTGAVTVKPGATLTIEPGVTVQFLLGSRLVVEGTLIARGTVEQPIRFTSAATKAPSFYDGDGVLFADSSADDRCLLEHCVVEHQRVGVTCSAASPTLRRCLFTRNGNVALLATDGAGPRVEDQCRFESNDGVGLRAEKAGFGVRRCLILKNADGGIHIADNSKGTIEASRICENAKAGIICDNFASPTIQACEIASNLGDGIRCDRSSGPTIQGNVIRGNRGAGVRCLRDSASTLSGNLIEANQDYPIVLEKSDGVIKGNTIVGNRPYGLNCASAASPRIEGNWIERNGAAGIICTEGSAPTITRNAILGHAKAISNIGSLLIQARENYFGDVDDKRMEDIIFDRGDDKTLGQVVWQPRLTEPPPRPPKPQLDLP